MSFLIFLALCHPLCLYYRISLDGQTSITLGPARALLPHPPSGPSLQYFEVLELSHSYLLSANYLICDHLMLIKGYFAVRFPLCPPSKVGVTFFQFRIVLATGVPGGKEEAQGTREHISVPLPSTVLQPYAIYSAGNILQTFCFSQINIHPLSSISSFDLQSLPRNLRKMSLLYLYVL